MPVTPGCNDAEENMLAVATLGKSPGAEKLPLLSCREGGRSKSGRIGKARAFPGGKVPADDRMQKLKGPVEGNGMAVSIGS